MERKLRILVIFAHPDDASLNAGGTLARWADGGHDVTAVCCTSGNLGTLRTNRTPEQVAAQRRVELMAARDVLAIRETVTLGHPDGGLLDAAALRRDLVLQVRRHRPDRVLTHDPWAPYEVHPDHRVVGRMAAEAAAFAAFPLLHPEQLEGEVHPHAPAEVWFMGILGRRPNRYVDISSTLERKIAAVKKFAATIGVVTDLIAGEAEGGAEEAPDAGASVRAMAADLGREVGLGAAEAFLVQKCLPGHFGNMRQCVADMLGRPGEPPLVL